MSTSSKPKHTVTSRATFAPIGHDAAESEARKRPEPDEHLQEPDAGARRAAGRGHNRPDERDHREHGGKG